MDNGLGVTPGAIAVTAGLKILSQILVVVDFTIEDDPNALIFIADRLVTGLDVDDAEATHSQSDVLLDKKAVIVGPAVDDLLVHRDEHVAIHSHIWLGMENTADSTHDYAPIPLGSLPGTIKSLSAQTRSSGCCNRTCSGSDEKISTFMAE